MNLLPILVRRELWEHRALWVAPLVVAGILVVLAIAGRSAIGDADVEAVGLMSDPDGLALIGLTHLAVPLCFGVVMAIVLFFYLLDCLYAERRDRSILFWKSLPVSDAATVISKLAVALVVAPLGVYVLSVVTDLLLYGIVALRLRGVADYGTVAPTWDTLVWLRLQAVVLLTIVILSLWYAPVAAYLLVISAWARRNVFLWAVLPPILLTMAELMATDTGSYTWRLLWSRLVHVWGELDVVGAASWAAAAAFGPEAGDPPLRMLSIFTSLDLWLGLVVAVLLVWAAIAIRRYREGI